MSDLAGGSPRRRADAQRSVERILDAALSLLAERPDVSMDLIARTAGVTRPTVYAHFPSRPDLIAAVVDRITAEAVSAIDAAGLDELPAIDGVLSLVEIGWQLFERYPGLLQIPGPTEDARHDPIVERLAAIIDRGRRSGEIDRTLPARWLVAAVMALGHAAGEQVGAGRMSHAKALAALRTSLVRLLTEYAPGRTGRA
ncbi:MAG TPA: TetR/AcrR family transcriptional regulator [Mycobacteriales bacterium]|nr:TetR/AcrR family transcriptional regulator [Mycobacteriales bacterium]